MKKLIKEDILRRQKLAGIISESQYNEGMEKNQIIDDLKAQAFELANSPEMDNLVDNILAKATPEELQAMQAAMQDIAAETGMMNEGSGDFASFSKLVDLGIDASEDGVMEEDKEVSELSRKVGKALDNLGVANIMSMGFLPALSGMALDYFGGTDILNTVSQAVGSGSLAAVLSVVAGLVAGGLLWKLGKKLQGVEVTGNTPLF